MTPSRSNGLRVERMLALLPDVDALAPLRAFLVASSRSASAGVEAHLTVGKRQIRAGDLPDLVPRALKRVTDHLTLLYAAAIDALEAEERGDPSAGVQAFLMAGDLERRVGREAAARVWYQHALDIAEALRDRQPEIEVLQRLGALDVAIGEFDRAARAHQRSFVLAESEEDSPRAADAAIAMGEISLQRENPRGAASWLARGEAHAAQDARRLGRIALGRAALGLATEDLDEAERRIRTADGHLAADDEGRILVLRAKARLAARRGHVAESLAHLREALLRLPSLHRDAPTEVAVRLEISEVFLGADRLPDAEDELRRIEEIAIEHNLGRDLARVYLLLGELRTRQRDETGFVFFEKAIELSRAGEPTPRLEAEAYLGYARFRAAFAEMEEARACLERAREIVDLVRDPRLEATVESALARVMAA